MSHSTFVMTLNPGLPDLTSRSTGLDGWSEYPVSAEFRSSPLSATRANGTFRLNRSALRERGDYRDYGRALGEGLFHGDFEELFAEALSSSGGDGSLHVLLSLEAPSVRELFWERLCAPLAPGPNGWNHLGASQRTPLSIYVAASTNLSFPPVGYGAVRTLLVVASPRGAADAPEFAGADFVTAIQSGAGDMPVTTLARAPGAHGLPTRKALINSLTQDRHTILYVVAHGTFPKAQNDFCLILENETGGADRVPGTELIADLGMLTTGGLPYLTILSSCYSAAWGGSYHERFAHRLVRELALPTVIGMAEPISVESARCFSHQFFQALRHPTTGGRPDIALARARSALIQRSDVLVPVLVSQIGAQPLFDSAVDTVPTDPVIIRKGLDVLEHELARRAPDLFDAAGQDGKELSGAIQDIQCQKPGDPAWDKALTTLNNVAEECLSSATIKMSFAGLCAQRLPPEYTSECPFRGMKAFDFTSRRYFKARATEVERLHAQLLADRVLAVVGPSGSGKSSLVFAGLLPKLFPDLTLDDTQNYFVNCVPGANPSGSLQHALQSATESLKVVVVDQFEELFTYSSTASDRSAFVMALKSLSESGKFVVITIRSEFRRQLRGTWLERFVADATRDVRPMTIDALRTAAVAQASVAGLQFETELLAEILRDLKDGAGRMPLLQHALKEVWRRRRGIWLKRAAYFLIGRVEGAVTVSANTFLKELDGSEPSRVKDLFLRLVRLAEDKSDPVQRARRRALREELIPAGEQKERTETLLKSLVDEVLVVTTETEAEVAHEALILAWETLDRWVSDSKDDSLRRQRLNADARRWADGGRRWRDRVLDEHQLNEMKPLEAHAELKLCQQEVDYLAACRSRRRWEFAGWLITVGLIIVLIAGVVYGLYTTGKRDRRVADELRTAFDRVKVEQESASRSLRNSQIAQSRFLAERASQALNESGDAVTAVALALEGLPSPTAVRPFVQETYSAFLAGYLARRELSVLSLGGAVTDGAVDPMGTRLATAGQNGVQVWDLLTRRKIADLAESTARVHRLRFSRDGRLLAAASHDGVARIWDMATLKEEALLKHPAGSYPICAAFSPDGSLVVTCGSNGMAKLWQRSTGQAIHELKGHTDTVWDASFSGDGETIVTASLDGTARLWDSKTGAEKAKLTGHLGMVNRAVFSPDGLSVLTVSSDDRSARLWDAKTGAFRSVFGTPFAPPRFGLRGVPDEAWEDASAEFSPNGMVVAVSTGVPTLYDSQNGKALGQLVGHRSGATRVAFSADGRLVATASHDKTARLWSAADGKQVACLGGHLDSVAGVAFSTTNPVLVTWSRDGSARVWNTDHSSTHRVIDAGKRRILDVATSPDGRCAVLCFDDSTADIWDLEGWSQIATLRGHTRPVIGARYCNDGSRIMTWSNDGTARVHGGKGELIAHFSGHVPEVSKGMSSFGPTQSGIHNGMLSGDGRIGITAVWNGSAKLWDASTGKELALFGGSRTDVLSVALTSDGSKAVCCLGGGSAEVWDTKSLKRIHKMFGGYGGIHKALFNSKNNRILTLPGHAMSAPDCSPILWDCGSFSRVSVLSGHSDEVRDAAFSEAGNLVATVSRDKTVKLWNSMNGESLATLVGHTDTPWKVVFNSAGSLLATCDSKELRLWSVADKTLIAVVRHEIGLPEGLSFLPMEGSLLVAGESELSVLSIGMSPTALISSARSSLPRLLAPSQRSALFLPPASGDDTNTEPRWPFDAETSLLSAESEFVAGDFVSALASISNALRSLDRSRESIGERNKTLLARALNVRAFVLLVTNSAAAALPDIERSLGLVAEPTYRDTRGQILVALGRMNDAQPDLDAAISGGIQAPSTFCARAEVHESKGDVPRAIEDYRRAVREHAPGNNPFDNGARARAANRLALLSSTPR